MIFLEGAWYHYFTSHQVPDIYWTDDMFIVRTGPVGRGKVVWE